MFRIRGQYISIMVMFAVTLHLFWAAVILLDGGNALGATGIAALYRYFHPTAVLIAVLTSASIFTIVGFTSKYPWSVLFLIPQQILLMMSAAGAIEAIFISQYADGVIRAWSFIAADQAYSVIAAIGHTLAMVMFVLRRNRPW